MTKQKELFRKLMKRLVRSRIEVAITSNHLKNLLRFVNCKLFGLNLDSFSMISTILAIRLGKNLCDWINSKNVTESGADGVKVFVFLSLIN